MKKTKKSVVTTEPTTLPEVKKPYEIPLIRNSIAFRKIYNSSPGAIYEKSEKLIKKHKA